MTLILVAGAFSARKMTADPVGGPKRNDDTVKSREIDVYDVKYTGGEQGDAKAIAENSSDDIDMKVYDPHGDLAASDTDDDAEPHCSWNVSSDYDWRIYKIKILNNEHHDVRYTVKFY